MSRLGLTQQQLADRIDVHRVTVADWVRGANEPRGVYLKALESLAEKAPVKKILERKTAETLATENLHLSKEVARLKRANQKLKMDYLAPDLAGSDSQEVKTIYRKLAQKYHPDHQGVDPACPSGIVFPYLYLSISFQPHPFASLPAWPQLLGCPSV